MTDSFYKEDLWGYGKRLSFVREAIASAYPQKPATQISVLDVGCGTGSSLGIPLAEPGFRYTGIDTHARSIEEGRRLASDLANANFVCGLVEALDAPLFDVVILSEVLEHVEDPTALLSTSLEKLTPDGLVIVTVPNGFGEFEWDSWIYEKTGLERLVAALKARRTQQDHPIGGSTLNVENGHVQFFTQKRLESIFADAGLEIVERRGSSIASGPFAAHTLGRLPGFVELNAKLADHLPMYLASGWFFSLRRREEKP